jgi:hypothetical protein
MQKLEKMQLFSTGLNKGGTLFSKIFVVTSSPAIVPLTREICHLFFSAFFPQ